MLKTEYPYNDDNNLIRHYAKDENQVQYKIKQIETGIIYDEAIDLYPCIYTYEETDIPVEILQEEQDDISNNLNNA